MALAESLGDREFEKFEVDSNGNTSIRNNAVFKGQDGYYAKVYSDGTIAAKDIEARTLLNQLLIEIKKMNIQLSLMTGTEL